MSLIVEWIALFWLIEFKLKPIYESSKRIIEYAEAINGAIVAMYGEGPQSFADALAEATHCKKCGRVKKGETQNVLTFECPEGCEEIEYHRVES